MPEVKTFTYAQNECAVYFFPPWALEHFQSGGAVARMRAPGRGHPGPTAPWASSSISSGGRGRSPRERDQTRWWRMRHPGLRASRTSSSTYAAPAGVPGAPLIKDSGLGESGENAACARPWVTGTRWGFRFGGVGVPFPNSCVGHVGGGGLFSLGY